jgi:hypothetical protein
VALLLRPHFKRLIKNDILHSLDFSNSKYAKQVKKGEAKRTVRILEIIHTNICGPLSVKSVDGFDLFITFMDDFCPMAIFIQLKNDKKHLINLRYLRLN